MLSLAVFFGDNRSVAMLYFERSNTNGWMSVASALGALSLSLSCVSLSSLIFFFFPFFRGISQVFLPPMVRRKMGFAKLEG